MPQVNDVGLSQRVPSFETSVLFQVTTLNQPVSAGGVRPDADPGPQPVIGRLTWILALRETQTPAHAEGTTPTARPCADPAWAELTFSIVFEGICLSNGRGVMANA